jgi:hypothetical protein
MPEPFSEAGVSTTRAPRKRSSLRRSTRVTARGLDHGLPGLQHARLFRALDDGARHAVLDRAHRVERLDFHVNVDGRRCQLVHPDQGGVADRLENVPVACHWSSQQMCVGAGAFSKAGVGTGVEIHEISGRNAASENSTVTSTLAPTVRGSSLRTPAAPAAGPSLSDKERAT